MLKEFKEFAMKGGLIDIAVGLVMATAFGLIVSSFVDGMFMPLVGKIFQFGDFAQAKVVLSEAVVGADGKVTTPESAILYGKVISAIINFIIVAFVMFLIVKGVNAAKKAEAAAPVPPSATETLLGEIRDLLKR